MTLRTFSIGIGLAGCIVACRQANVVARPTALHLDSAVMFAPGVVSTGDVFASTFTPDGKTVVFTKFSPPNPMTLMTSSFVNGSWTPPKALPFSGSFRDLDPSFSPDGSRLYFSSARPSGPSPADTLTGVDTWFVDRQGTDWSAPVRLPSPINSIDADMYPSVTRRGTLYFDSARSRPSKRMVYRADLGSGVGAREPEPLGPMINADSGASNLFVDPEERYVIFGAARPDGRGGLDLYISWRNSSDWTRPINLGAAVNSEAVEFCPFVSRDGKTLYFTRITTLSNKQVERNVFMVPFDADRFRPNR